MIILRSDGDDDQPRDENGQWSSGGGGLSSPRSPQETKKLKEKLKQAQAHVKLSKMIGPKAEERAQAALAEIQKQLGDDAPKAKSVELKTPAPKPTKAPTAGEHVNLLKTFREKLPLDEGPSGYAQGTTSEIAEAFGVAPKEALALLQKAAKEGLVTRRGHAGTVGSGKKASTTSGFGYQMWELMNSTKLP